MTVTTMPLYRFRILGAIAAACVLLAPVPAAANRIVGGWSAAGIAHLPAENVRLLNKNNEVLATVSRTRVVRLVDVLSRVEKSAGVTAELFVVQYGDSQPNAFAVGKEGRNIVGITPAMLELVGDDFDAYAAIFGHELAHLVKEHGSGRASRQGLLQGLGLIAGILIGARTGINPSSLIDLGTTIADRSFSREEEREADRLGVEYMIAAGFDSQGAVRLQQRMSEAGKAGSTGFLSTHPSGEERIANLQQILASQPPAAKPPAVARSSDRKDVEELVRRGNWYGLLAVSEEQATANPTDAFWWFHKALAHQKLGDHKEAVPAYQNALKHEPEYKSALLNLGYSYLQTKQPDKSAPAFEGAIRATPDNASAWFGLGIAYFQLGQRDKAWDTHQELKKLDPKRAERFAQIASVPAERPEPQPPNASGVSETMPGQAQDETQEPEAHP
ncbi:MAG TPA: M48 family metalloprotease [Burkholderiales bacterium]|nr:M48 family metalloprotease [Burkholderiales bacterium]